jgi:predicted exporter
MLAGLSVIALRRLELGGSIYDLFPREPGPVADLASYTRRFGGREELIALVRGSDPTRVERATRELAAELSLSPLLKEVRAGVEGAAAASALAPSLLLLAGPEVWPAVARRLTVDLPSRVAHLRGLALSPISVDRRLITADPLLLSELVLGGLDGGVSRRSGLYASPDGRAALVFGQPVGPSSDGALCARLAVACDRLRRAHSKDGVFVQFTGGHLYAASMAQALRRDLAISSVLALLGVALVQLFFFRSLRLLPLSALTAGAALAFTLAVAALSVGHLNALSLAFAALFIGMSDDALIHITAQTRAFAAEPPAARMRLAVLTVAPATITATLTVVAAFLCFGLGSFAGLAHTGLLAACGLGMNLVLALVFFPALGTLLPPGPGPSGATLVDRWLGRLSSGAQRQRTAVLLGALLLGAAALFAARELRFSEDLTRLAPSEIEPARADRAIAAAFERDQNRFIVLTEGNDLESALAANDRVAESLASLARARGPVSSYLTLSRLLPSLATQRSRRARLQALGPEPIAERLRAALDEVGLRGELFDPFLRALRDPIPLTRDRLPPSLRPLVARYLAPPFVATIVYTRPGVRVGALAPALEQLSSATARVRVTGASAAGEQMATLLRRDLYVISGTTLAAVLVLLALLVRRLWPVVATLLSLLLAGVLFAGSLQLLGLEMDLYNLMVIPIIIGYGVDDHLYLVHRSLQSGLRAGLVESGRPVLAATLSTMAAFVALAFCELPGLRTLGLTGTLGLGLGLATSLLVMPALLSLAPSYRDSDGE